MESLVECVANFSEGRRPEVVAALVAALTSVPGVYLLDREMDADHNRCVITVVGPKEKIGEAAVRAAAKAAELIDLNTHRGEHPRIGATDVIPFIPIRNATMEDCVRIAQWTGQEIFSRVGIPVYLYEAAARSPDRINLENLRKGQFEGLRETVKADPTRRPDFGQAQLHPTAGATVVGARKPLIAYNIVLDTADVEVARQVARAVRHSSGGLRHVKAMGVMLQSRGRAQVSMNLTDFERTPIHRAFKMVESEARRHGCRIISSEIVGLVPQKALHDAAEFFLQIENFSSNLILENRLADAMARTTTFNDCSDFLDRLASAAPVPGGGCAAALALAMAASLGLMAIRLTRGRVKYQEFDGELATAQQALAECATRAQASISQDAEAFLAVMRASDLPKDTDEQRTARAVAVEAATITAAEVPLGAARNGVEIGKLLHGLEGKTNPNCASDLKVAVLLCSAGIRGLLENVRVNAQSLKDATARARLESELRSILAVGARLVE